MNDFGRRRGILWDKAEARSEASFERATVMVLASHNLELCSRW